VGMLPEGVMALCEYSGRLDRQFKNLGRHHRLRFRYNREKIGTVRIVLHNKYCCC